MGIKLKCKVKGITSLEKKINRIINEIPNLKDEIVKEILSNIQGYAIKLENGHNSKGILVEIIETSTMEVKGRVYADPNKFITDSGKPYLWFEYFGTGQYAEQDHIGKTKHFIESGYTEWYIPVHKAGRKLNYPIVTINNIKFYVAVGAKGNHFIEDAEFKTREENKKIAKKKLDSFFKEVCK